MNRNDKTDPGFKPPAMEPAQVRAAPAQPRAVPQPAARFFPHNPRTLEETKLSSTQIESAVLKAIFFAGEMRGIDIARHLRLPHQLVEPALEQLRRVKSIDVRGGGQGFGLSNLIYALTSLASEPLKQIFELNRYDGPAPVLFENWVAAVRAQTVRGVRVTRTMLAQKLDGLIVNEAIFDGIGPAMNAGRSIFFYGPPGNGKTAICQRMASCYSWDIYVPYAVDIDGFVVKIYDETIHRAVKLREGDPPIDERWVKCRRPLVTVGGELTMDMLDLAYSAETKIYEAPLQMKASNGVLLIDDLGRQRITPRELLNRWIFPLENDVDYLRLGTGRRFAIPFDAFLVFSTNLDPQQLVDDAFLRRVRYKLKIEPPDELTYKAIFRAQCELKGLLYIDHELDTFLISMRNSGRQLAACQPRDLVAQVIDHAVYRNERAQLSADALDRAARTYFARFP